MKRLFGGLIVALALTLASGSTSPSMAQTKSKDSPKKKSATTATFEIYKDATDDFRFRLRDGDGHLLAISGKGYEKKEDCQKVIDSIKDHAAKAKVEDNSDKSEKSDKKRDKKQPPPHS